MGQFEIVRATSADLEDLYELDSLVFGSSDPTLEPATPEEFEGGLREGTIYIASADGALAGFAHMDPLGTKSIFLASLAVHPDYRRLGVGRTLLDRVLRDAEGSGQPVLTAASPDNLAMLRLLLEAGFVATDYVTDYYGEAKHRFVLERFNDHLIRTAVDTKYVPLTSTETVRSQLTVDDWTIQAVHSAGGRDYFEFARLDVRDRKELQANELQAGIAFSGTVLAALTFLLGFAISSSRFSDDTRVLLAVAVTASLFSMVAYANASGDLARLKADRFVLHMETGNALSEYGGLVPLFVIVPVALMAVVETSLAAWFLGLTGSLVLILYFLSVFSLWTRYQRGWWSWLFVGIIASAPALWLLVPAGLIPSVAWTTAVIAALVAATVDLQISNGEASLHSPRW